MKYFNTTGPCREDEHYMLPPEPRLPEAREYIERGNYFVLHAPRQSGKTTVLETLARTLNAEGEYVAVSFSCETAQTAKTFEDAEARLLGSIAEAAEDMELAPELRPPDPWPDAVPGNRLRRALRDWAVRCPFPLVLFFDEIDTLTGDNLVSVLSQLRDGHRNRPHRFPHSVVLCGLRDVRDYKAAPGGDPERLGSSSPFNIKVDSLRLADFTYVQVTELYEQHTEATGQKFTPEAVQRAFEASQGQPWLVNALAREVIDKMRVPVTEPVTDKHMETAVERLIVARATHLDSLVARLNEPPVKRIIEPMIAGTVPSVDLAYNDDASYARDLGLIKLSRSLQMANPIYQEVVVRVLTEQIENAIQIDSRSFVTSEGRLDFELLLEEFTGFWSLHGEIISREHNYAEAACQLVFMAWLHRVVNGGGLIDREYAVGRGRIDILVRWPLPDGTEQWEAVELKVHHRGRADPETRGLVQLDGYLRRMGLPCGTLIVFDQRSPMPTITGSNGPSGRPVTLVRL
ncbi:ATP-binding protein [Actinocorallia populi]|uniref:ATP-binding protein n=1 Tax=Actinocorallia populi TaxID=2079200 RepID=UPI000D08F40B|nr:ATP-binding protein [Actinocorallia populi]